jgi:hypothetical protein
MWRSNPPFDWVKDPAKYADTLRNAYPLVNLLDQSYAIAAWWESNPSKRKTKRGVKRFINAWIADKQRRAEQDQAKTQRKKQDGDPHASTVAAVWGDRSNAKY